ncbi:TPA: hypothetical protein ACGQTY_002495 [Citrobacter farmeri]|uniref:hypothetical protein n=1 Tax=Citrobacter amalonaticus TaxID=35703 RepID=UPI001C7DAD77|nr:hypothetical protein [Citrobacter amalonaticus]QZA35367.1 hypothetical protein K1713_17220 [Citrobacter amalonaticus]
MSLKELKLPHEQRTEYQKKLTELLSREFSPDDFIQREFIEAVLLVMQSVCGPAEVAMVIRGTQIRP